MDELEILIQLALLVTAIFALNTWRKQLNGGNEYQVAFDLLLRARQLSEKIQKDIRNPMLHPISGKSFEDWNWERDVYAERFTVFYDFKNGSYDEAALKAEILFGEVVKPLLKEIDERIVEVQMAYEVAYRIFRGRNKYDDEQMLQQYKEKIQKNRELLWYGFSGEGDGEKDAYSLRLESAVINLEKFLHTKIEG